MHHMGMTWHVYCMMRFPEYFHLYVSCAVLDPGFNGGTCSSPCDAALSATSPGGCEPACINGFQSYADMRVPVPVPFSAASLIPAPAILTVEACRVYCANDHDCVQA